MSEQNRCWRERTVAREALWLIAPDVEVPIILLSEKKQQENRGEEGGQLSERDEEAVDDATTKGKGVETSLTAQQNNSKSLTS